MHHLALGGRRRLSIRAELVVLPLNFLGLPMTVSATDRWSILSAATEYSSRATLAYDLANAKNRLHGSEPIYNRYLR